MKKIVFLAHEFGLFPGHGGVASYLDILVNQILERNDDVEVHVFTYVFDKKNAALKNKRFKINTITGDNLHEQGVNICKYLKKVKPDYVECADYLALGLESVVYKYESDDNELSDTVFITLHHTASRECFEWNDRIPVKYASPFIQECFARERVQMRLSDLNVAPSSFMNHYVTKNYGLRDVKTVLHPIVVEQCRKEKLLDELKKDFDIEPYKGKFIVNCISRVEGRKNQALLVDQFIRFLKKTNADALLFIIGNSSVNSVTGRNFRNEIYDTIPEEYRKKILFFDFMNSKGKKRMLTISDVSVLASPFECLSLAMTESVGYEVPVLCSKYCGFSDYMGGSVNDMTFDPFKENDLCSKLEKFYNASSAERKNIISEQEKGVKELASFEKTIDARLKLYEEAQSAAKSAPKCSNALVIDERNCFDTVDEKIVSRKYDSILVDFYFNKNLVIILEKWFYNMSSRFRSGDIICYSGESTKQCYVNAVLESRPFFINDIIIGEEDIGTSLADLISKYVQSDTVIYSLTDINDGLPDSVKGQPSYAECNRRDSFNKTLLSNGFYKENLIDLEDRI